MNNVFLAQQPASIRAASLCLLDRMHQCTLGQLRGSGGHTAKEVWKVSKLTQIVFWVLFEATMHGISTILDFPTLI